MTERRVAIEVGGRHLEIAVRTRRSSDSRSKVWCVFIHGLGCTLESFDDAFDAEALDDFSLLALDLPGHGDSDRPEDFGYTMDDHASAVAALLDSLGCEAVHLIGHSMGGAVAQLLLDRLPAPPRSVVSVEGNLIDDDCRFGSREIAAVSIDEFLVSGFEAFRASIDPKASAGYARYVDWVSRVSPVALHRSAVSLVEWSDSGTLLDSFLTLPGPAAYIYGAENDQAEVVPLLQSATVIRVPDAGHFAMNDNPGFFYRVLAEWLQSLGSRRAVTL